MIKQYPPMEKFMLSYSSRNALRSCPSKTEFYKFWQLARHQVPELAPDTGKALHAAFQHWFIHRDEDAAIMELLMRYPFEVNTNSNDDRSIEAAYSTLMAMFNYVALDDYEPVFIKKPNGETAPAIEVPFEIKVKNFFLDNEGQIPVSYIGFVDYYARNIRTQKIGATDIKTHRNTLNDMTPVYQNEDQVVPYQLVLDKIQGVEQDGLDVRYLSCFVDLLAPKVAEYEFYKDREHVMEWCRGLFNDLSQIKQYYQLGWFPKYGNSCMNYRKRCGLFDVCGLRGEAQLKEIAFQQEVLKEFGVEQRPFEPWVVVELDLGL